MSVPVVQDRVPAPTFVDLRKFAANGRHRAAAPQAAQGDAFLACRRSLPRRPARVEVGAIDLPAGRGAVRSTTADEFLIVAEGGVRFEHAGKATQLGEGQSIVLPRGVDFTWECATASSLSFVRHASDAAGAAGLVRIDESAPLAPSSPPLPELLLTPTPACRSHVDFRSADGLFTCGTWDSTAYRRRPMLFRHCELMCLLEGTVTLEDDAGARATFTRGDVVVVETGAVCSWDHQGHVKKVYAVFRPV